MGASGGCQGSASPAGEPNLAAQGGRKLLILHFNDVYNIEPSDREGYVSGPARLAGMIHAFDAEHPLVLFSGDAFSPSAMSTITLGQHMPPVLNTFGIAAACIGNHDFDLGLASALSLVKQCNFPWLASNLVDRETGVMFPGLHETLMLEHQGVKVGVMGLIEAEWLETLASVPPEALLYTDFVTAGTRLAAELRAQGAELVVAITHMRENNDRLLAASIPGIDLVLGGHDHHYEVDYIEPHNTLMAKSGTDFRDLTRIDLTLPAPGQEGKPVVTWEHMPVRLDSPQYEPTTEAVAHFSEVLGARMDEVIAYTLTPLDSTFATVRLSESNMGNMICDILRAATGADIVIINAGTLRSDQVHGPGPFRLGELVDLLPMPDGLVTLEATGQQVLQALENGVSQVPRLEGRFPQLSGLRFKYNSSRPAGSRVLHDSLQVLSRELPSSSSGGGSAASHAPLTRSPSVMMAGKERWVPLDLSGKTLYRLAVKAYMAEGKDGYDALEECKVLVNDEEGPILSQAVRNHFRSLKVLNMWDPKVKLSAIANKWRMKAREHSHSRIQDLPDEVHDPCIEAAESQLTQEANQLHLEDHHIAPWVVQEGGEEGGDLGQRLASLRVTSLPSRSCLFASDTGICVLDPEHGYVLKPEVDGRMVDVAPSLETLAEAQ